LSYLTDQKDSPGASIKKTPGNPTGTGKKFPVDPYEAGRGQLGNAVKPYVSDLSRQVDIDPFPSPSDSSGAGRNSLASSVTPR
jgi:hypothetical protein